MAMRPNRTATSVCLTSRAPGLGPNAVDLTLVPFALRPAQDERNKHNFKKTKSFVLSLSKDRWLKQQYRGYGQANRDADR